MELVGSSWGDPSPESAKIVLLHGMGGTGKLWRPVAASLEENYSIFAPDQRGHGGSRVPTASGDRSPITYTPLDYGRDLVETLDRRNFHPTWVVGHSMGVRSACAVAHLKPEWIRGLVLVDLGFAGAAGGGLGEDLARFVHKLPSRFESRADARAFMDQESPDPSMAQYLLAVSETDPTTGELRFPFDSGALIETIHSARDTSVRNWLRDLGSKGMPILILRGAESLVWTREEFETERDAFKDLPSLVFEEVAGTGHGLPFEKRAFFVERLRRFFS